MMVISKLLRICLGGVGMENEGVLYLQDGGKRFRILNIFFFLQGYIETRWDFDFKQKSKDKRLEIHY